MPALVPGILAPPIDLPAAESRKVVLIFVPSDPQPSLGPKLKAFQDQQEAFSALDVSLFVITDGPKGDIPLSAMSVLETEPGLPDAFGVGRDDGRLLPAVFVLDDTRRVRRTYAQNQQSDLPNPAMVLRSIKKLTDQPSPPIIEEQDWQLGPKNAPVVVIEYSDYQCHPCQEVYKLLAEVLPIYDDNVLWVHRHLPLRTSHPLAQQAAEAAEAAGVQGHFWEMHRRLFNAAGNLEFEQLMSYAAELELDIERFRTELQSHLHRPAVNTDLREAVKNGIKLPPMLFINQLVYDGPRTTAGLRSQIEALLACQAQLLNI